MKWLRKMHLKPNKTKTDFWIKYYPKFRQWTLYAEYRKTSNIKCTLVGNKIVDHSDVVGASPVGAAPTTASFSTWHLASRDSAKKAAGQYENLLSVGFGASYIRDLTVNQTSVLHYLFLYFCHYSSKLFLGSLLKIIQTQTSHSCGNGRVHNNWSITMTS